MPTGLFTRCDLDSETGRFTSHQNKTGSFEKRPCLIFNEENQNLKSKVFTLEVDNKIDCFSIDGFCFHCNTVLEAMGYIYHFRPCQEVRPSFSEKNIKRGCVRRELDALRRNYIQEKGLTVIEVLESEWWTLYKTTTNLIQHVRRISLTDVHWQVTNSQKKKKNGKLFG